MVAINTVLQWLMLRSYTFIHVLAIAQLAAAHVELPQKLRKGGKGGGGGGGGGKGKGGSSSSGSKVIKGIKGSKGSKGSKSETSGGQLSMKQGIIIGVLILVVIAIVIFVKWWLHRNRRLKRQLEDPQPQTAAV